MSLSVSDTGTQTTSLWEGVGCDSLCGPMQVGDRVVHRYSVYLCDVGVCESVYELALQA